MMFKLLKPFGTLGWERGSLGKMVDLMGLTKPEGAEREKELAEKLAVCDILQADVDIEVNEALFEKAPNLKAVFCTSIGLDYVDLEAASKRGILVANSPDFCVLSVAEYAIGMLYALLRRIPEGVWTVKEDNWKARNSLGGMELYGKTLGVVGFGKTGREVARQALGIGMNVNAYDPYMNTDLAISMGAVPMSMDEVLKSADIVTIHVPLMEETWNLISHEQFNLMKNGVYLVNVARGGIVDESALLVNLKSGKVAGAALDVLSAEPPELDHPLIAYSGKNLIITPHIAWYTREAALRNHEFYTRQVEAFVNGQTPMAVANKCVIKESERV